VDYAAEKPSNKLLAVTELDSDTRVGEVKRIWARNCRDFCFPLSQFQLFGTPSRALAAETLKLEQELKAEG
jgi:hypothetical protein